VTLAEAVRLTAVSMGVMLSHRECEVVSVYMRVNSATDYREAIRQCYPLHVRSAIRCAT
jgi:hypothetical protein